jgi:hypothetical protein
LEPGEVCVGKEAPMVMVWSPAGLPGATEQGKHGGCPLYRDP